MLRDEAVQFIRQSPLKNDAEAAGCGRTMDGSIFGSNAMNLPVGIFRP
jgi:hypothetical protein